jgi:hypothetical protein
MPGFDSFVAPQIAELVTSGCKMPKFKECDCFSGHHHHQSHSQKHEKHCKRGKRGCRGKKGKTGLPGPIAQEIAFGATSFVPDDAILPFYLLVSSNGVTGTALDASTDLTAPYAYVALQSTNKIDVSASIAGNDDAAQVALTITVATPTLPVTAAASQTITVSKPFEMLAGLSLNVAQGNIVYISAAPVDADLDPAAFTGITVILRFYQG